MLCDAPQLLEARAYPVNRFALYWLARRLVYSRFSVQHEREVDQQITFETRAWWGRHGSSFTLAVVAEDGSSQVQVLQVATRDRQRDGCQACLSLLVALDREIEASGRMSAAPTLVQRPLAAPPAARVIEGVAS